MTDHINIFLKNIAPSAYLIMEMKLINYPKYQFIGKISWEYCLCGFKSVRRVANELKLLTYYSFCNIWGCVCSNDRYRFRWSPGYICVHLIINCKMEPSVCVRMCVRIAVSSYSYTCFTIIPGKLGFVSIVTMQSLVYTNDRVTLGPLAPFTNMV